jgi:hypothetical protein
VLQGVSPNLIFFSVYEVCNPKYFTPEVCAQQNYVYPSFPYLYSGYPYNIAPLTCGCPLRAGEVNLQNIQWTLPELGGVKAIVQVIMQSGKQL